VVQIIPNVNLRIKTENKGARTIAILHEGGVITFWNEDTLELVYTFRLNAPSKMVVFETSYRYLASLTENGSVEIWKVKGKSESYQWSLSFKSVVAILNNPTRENQFIISMNSKDDSSLG
jgi:hypothetical protein